MKLMILLIGLSVLAQTLVFVWAMCVCARRADDMMDQWKRP